VLVTDAVDLVHEDAFTLLSKFEDISGFCFLDAMKYLRRMLLPRLPKGIPVVDKTINPREANSESKLTRKFSNLIRHITHVLNMIPTHAK